MFTGVVACFVTVYGLRNQAGTYRIVEVFDGDTIAVDMQGVPEKIRMIGMDTPETKDPRKPVQCYGPEASAYTHETLKPGVRVKLVADPVNSNRDRYGRLLRYVYLTDGTLYNESLLRQGYAHPYDGFLFSKMKQFDATAATAKAQGRGLWSACPTDA